MKLGEVVVFSLLTYFIIRLFLLIHFYMNWPLIYKNRWRWSFGNMPDQKTKLKKANSATYISEIFHKEVCRYTRKIWKSDIVCTDRSLARLYSQKFKKSSSILLGKCSFNFANFQGSGKTFFSKNYSKINKCHSCTVYTLHRSLRPESTVPGRF